MTTALEKAEANEEQTTFKAWRWRSGIKNIKNIWRQHVAFCSRHSFAYSFVTLLLLLSFHLNFDVTRLVVGFSSSKRRRLESCFENGLLSMIKSLSINFKRWCRQLKVFEKFSVINQWTRVNTRVQDMRRDAVSSRQQKCLSYWLCKQDLNVKRERENKKEESKVPLHSLARLSSFSCCSFENSKSL